VLQGTELTIRRGVVTMILGRSGSGKTTLLKVLQGLLKPQRGQVRVPERSAASQQPAPAPRMAYIPQNLGLVRSMSALENTLAGALRFTATWRALFRAFPAAVREEAGQTLTRLGLAHKLHERVCRLSGGERQRVAIARALMQQPDLILADEFVSQLDPVTARDILDMVRDFANQGIGFLVTTHETDVVADYADHLLVMNAGRIIYDGDAKTISQASMVELVQ
jgi:phosphonate transport system ATP-binding protein